MGVAADAWVEWKGLWKHFNDLSSLVNPENARPGKKSMKRDMKKESQETEVKSPEAN